MKKLKNIVLLMFLSIWQMHSANYFPLKVVAGKIVYEQDEKGNRIIDFSYCGYHQSNDSIPLVNNVIYIPHTESNASASIQRAIDRIASLPPDSKGHRGAVILAPGVYELDKSIIIHSSGIVLRGSDKKQTILKKTGFDRGSVIYIRAKRDAVLQDTATIINSYVPVNAKSFQVSRANLFRVGERIKITRPSTAQWISSIGCNIFGGGIDALGWKPGDVDIVWERKIASVNGNTITIDAPITTAIDAKFGSGIVTRYIHPERISESGIENLTLISAFNQKNQKDEDHSWNGISVENAENCWIRQVDFRHFAGSTVVLQPTSMQITVEDCRAYQPVSEIGGHRRIVFYTLGQLNLFQRCYSENGIHDFAAGYCAAGPNAFVQCQTYLSKSFSGSVGSWASGLLFDIVNIDGNNLSLKNLEQDKNGTGWNAANSMLWQCTASRIDCYSPATDATNSAYGSWAQYNGNGNWAESNNHVQPRSLFYAQLAERLKADVSKRAKLLPVSTDASSSPTLEMAARMADESRKKVLTLEEWIDLLEIKPSSSTVNIKFSLNEPRPMRIKEYRPEIGIKNGKITVDNTLITGGKLEVAWWNGKLRKKNILSSKPHITRFVPAMEGFGLTDYIDSVVNFMQTNQIAVLDHNYGLWYDRRRDDHQRIRRSDGDVWAPFYEQPFARSGEGTAWDGLSKYDLTQPNQWYWMRLKEFSSKARKKGILLYHQHFFQHNILEAGAHWVDSPWRTVNNINNTGFNEPVHFAGDKRVFVADDFYDVNHPVRRALLRNYIRMCLDELSDYDNVVHLISQEYTGPLHFVQFWLDVIEEWQTETGKNPFIALSCTKDVQDAILKDPVRSKLIDIIDIRYWHYKDDRTVYAPDGGKNLAPRQHARLEKVGRVTFTEAYKAVKEYRDLFPDKAVTYYAQNYPEMSWAIFMAGGSCPSIPVKDINFLTDAAHMTRTNVNKEEYYSIENPEKGIIFFTTDKFKSSFSVPKGKYEIRTYDAKNGKQINKTIRLNCNGNYLPVVNSDIPLVWWFKKL
jgi:hypothetical protein